MIFSICFIFLTVALALTAYRLFRGPSAADRILALDLLAVITAAGVLIYIITTGQQVFLDVLVVFGLIVFFGTVALAHSISRDI
jgi:multisubunit Na+/H+ antiporter MnhF subunit